MKLKKNIKSNFERGKTTGFPAALNTSAKNMTICEELHLIAFGCPYEDKCEDGKCLIAEED
jgi:hypothetical protein